jgi:hypothetical protein
VNIERMIGAKPKRFSDFKDDYGDMFAQIRRRDGARHFLPIIPRGNECTGNDRKYLYWFTFDNAYQRRRGCNRTELETRLLKEQPVFFFSSFDAAWKY